MDDERQNAISELVRTPDLLQQLVLDVDEAKMDVAPPHEWTIRVVMAHLLSVEWQVFRLRLERMLTEDQPAVAVFDQEAWAAEYQRQPLELSGKIISNFTVQRQASVRLIENMREADWSRGANHPERGQISVDWLVKYWAWHDQNHLNQITQLLGESGE